MTDRKAQAAALAKDWAKILVGKELNVAIPPKMLFVFAAHFQLKTHLPVVARKNCGILSTPRHMSIASAH